MSGPVLDLQPVLAELVPWLRAGGAEPFLWGGTLLGFWRDGHLLPWDGDIDLGLLAEEARDIDLLRPPAGWEVYRDTPLQSWMRQVAELTRGNVGLRRPGSRVGLHLMARGRGGDRYFTCKRALIRVPDPAPLVPYLLPTGERLAVPANTDAVLDWYYGPWRQPDPTYIGSERERASQARYFVTAA